MTPRDETPEHRAFALPGSRPQYGPDKNVAVEHIDLYLVPDLGRERLEGVCTTTVRALDERVERLVLDAVDLSIASVERDGKPLRFSGANGKLEIVFEPPIAPAERASFAVAYETTKPRHGLFFVKPSPANPAQIAHAWTQSQDENARYWFPCLDYPHEKQRTTTTIVVPRGSFALSNGALVERVEEGERVRYRYEQEVPHSTYLVTMVVGPFVEVAQGTAGKHGVPVFYYVLPGREAEGERSFGNTKRMIDTFEERTGMPYPYARYSQIAVSDFIFGGMENTSATTQTDRTLHDEAAHLDFSSDPLVSHELAHQWFGDLLTCRDWAHAWLNEGFATFFEAVWRETDLGYDEYVYDIFECVAAYLAEDADRYRRPIVCNTYRNPIEIFDRHLYQKGAAVLHMLRGELGEARFWRSIRTYVQRNAQRNVETIDFVRAIEEATGRNMREFFDRWVYRAGHPRLEIRCAWDEERKAATVTIDQKQTIDDDNPPFQFDVQIGLVSDAGTGPGDAKGWEPLASERRVRARVENAHETMTVVLDARPTMLRFDPGAFVLGDVSYHLGTELATAALRGDPDPVARIRAARELAKDGSRAAREALATAIFGDRFWGVSAEAASAIGATRAPWARPVLVEALSHPHPKVRRAAAAALGAYRDGATARALVQAGGGDASYFVRAAALTSLGKTRDAGAFDVLADAIRQKTWNGTVEAGAARGLAELADARALPLLRDAAAIENEEGLRRAAAAAIGRLAELVHDVRSAASDALEQLLDDSAFLVQLSALAAAESLNEACLLPALDRIAQVAFDARVRRDAMEAAIRVRESAKVPGQVTSMREDIDELREAQRTLQEKIEALSRS